jgi:hypothetical protein
MAIATAAQVRVYIPSLTGTAADTDIGTLIDRFDALAARYIGFPVYDSGTNPTLEDQTYTFILDGQGGRTLYCPIRPLVSITSIYDDPTGKFAAATLIAATDYNDISRLGHGEVVLDSDAVHGVWSDAEYAIKLTVVAGWSTIPSEIVEACCQWVAAKFNNRGSHGRSSVGVGEAVVNLTDVDDVLPPAVRAILAPYRCFNALMMGA